MCYAAIPPLARGDICCDCSMENTGTRHGFRGGLVACAEKAERKQIVSDIFELFKKIAGEKKEPAGPPTHLIVGLGNPGAEYIRTRHNAGFIAADHIARRCGAECSRIRFHSMNASVDIGGHQVLLMKPQTFMNQSGQAVGEAAAFYKIPPGNIIVLVDDIYLPPGRMRIRAGGTDGGHNGLKDIIYHLSADAFPRIRIGVGEKKQGDLVSWVLGKFSEADLTQMAPCFAACYDAAVLIMDGKTEEAMGRFNGMKPTASKKTQAEQDT